MYNLTELEMERLGRDTGDQTHLQVSTLPRPPYLRPIAS